MPVVKFVSVHFYHQLPKPQGFPWSLCRCWSQEKVDKPFPLRSDPGLYFLYTVHIAQHTIIGQSCVRISDYCEELMAAQLIRRWSVCRKQDQTFLAMPMSYCFLLNVTQYQWSICFLRRNMYCGLSGSVYLTRINVTGRCEDWHAFITIIYSFLPLTRFFSYAKEITLLYN